MVQKFGYLAQFFCKISIDICKQLWRYSSEFWKSRVNFTYRVRWMNVSPKFGAVCVWPMKNFRWCTKIVHKGRTNFPSILKRRAWIIHIFMRFAQVFKRFNQKYNKMHKMSATFSNVYARFQREILQKETFALCANLANMHIFSEIQISLHTGYTVYEQAS